MKLILLSVILMICSSYCFASFLNKIGMKRSIDKQLSNELSETVMLHKAHMLEKRFVDDQNCGGDGGSTAAPASAQRRRGAAARRRGASATQGRAGKSGAQAKNRSAAAQRKNASVPLARTKPKSQ